MKLHLSLLALVLAPALPRAQSNLWVVDGQSGPGSDFTTIQAAVDAAGPGDGILVREGFYLPFAIIGKSLTLLGEGAKIQGQCLVADLGATQSVTLRGLDFIGPFVFIEDCAGAVVLESSGPLAESVPLVFARNSASVTLTGYRGRVLAIDSSMQVFDSQLVGSGGGLYLCDGFGLFNGVEAARVHGSSFFASGTEFLGGDGECSLVKGCICHGPGSSGLLIDEASFVQTVGCTFVGGSGDPPAPPVEMAEGGIHLQQAGPPRSVRSEFLVLDGELSSLALSGEPNELYVLLLSGKLFGYAVPGIVGPIVPLPPWVILSSGVLSPTGTLDLPLPIGDIHVDYRVYHVQMGVLSALGTVHFSAPTALAVLDQG